MYESLEKLQAAMAGPAREPEAAGHSPPSPQENSYTFMTGSTPSAAGPLRPLAVPPGAPAQPPDWLQKGPNQPVESDESVSGLSVALQSWHLSPSCPPGLALPGGPGQGAAGWGPSPSRTAGGPQGGAAQAPSWGSGLGPQLAAVEGSWGQVPRRGTGGLLR